MLWHKGWLETRLRLLFMLAWEAIFLGAAYLRGVKDMASFTAVLIGGVFLGAFVPIFLAGAGINTQASFQPAKGLHGSMLFTLSMPVSRLRLLAIRAGIGWLEMAAAIATWCCAGVCFCSRFSGPRRARRKFSSMRERCLCVPPASIPLACCWPLFWTTFGGSMAA